MMLFQSERPHLLGITAPFLSGTIFFMFLLIFCHITHHLRSTEILAMQKKSKQKQQKKRPHTRSGSPFCQAVRVLLVIGFHFFHQFDTYVFISAQTNTFVPMRRGKQNKIGPFLNGKERYGVGDWGSCNHPAAFIACCYESFHAAWSVWAPASWRRLCFCFC